MKFWCGGEVPIFLKFFDDFCCFWRRVYSFLTILNPQRFIYLLVYKWDVPDKSPTSNMIF